MPRLALYGGSFNPPHVAHQMVMLEVLATARVDGLWVVPAFRHAFDKQLAPFEHRLAMARLAVEPFRDGRVEVSDVERRLGESRTLKTVRALLDERPGTEVVVVVGSDLVGELTQWYGWDELRRLVELFVVEREGSGTDAGAPVVLPDISSSEVRARIGRGESVEGLVPANVIDYIARHGLYRDAAP